jgi:hypothetical protein
MDDAKRLSETMRCLIAEWGAEHFQLNLPRKWEAYADNAFKRPDFHYVTDNSIVIKVLNVNSNYLRHAPSASFDLNHRWCPSN